MDLNITDEQVTTDDAVSKLIDDIILSQMLSLEIAKLLLAYFFPTYNEKDLTTEKAIRRFLVTEFYIIMRNKQTEYFEELSDYSKNADYHLLTQKRIKIIANLGLNLQQKLYHDEIVYFMNIMS